LQLVDEVRQELPRLGTRKLVDQLKKHHDTEVGRDRLFTWLRQSGRLVKRKKRWDKTTYSRHGYAVAPNRIKELVIAKPNQVLVCDCTYMRLVGRKFAYLFLVSDASAGLTGQTVNVDAGSIMS